jgi:hypothetical protein
MRRSVGHRLQSLFWFTFLAFPAAVLAAWFVTIIVAYGQK